MRLLLHAEQFLILSQVADRLPLQYEGNGPWGAAAEPVTKQCNHFSKFSVTTAAAATMGPGCH